MTLRAPDAVKERARDRYTTAPGHREAAKTVKESSRAPPTTTPMPPARERLGDVALVFLVALGALTLDLYLPALPAQQADLYTAPAVAQLTLTATTIGLAVGQLLVGPWTDAVGRRVPLVASIVVDVLASIGVAVAPEIVSLLGCRFLQGVDAAGGGVVTVAVVRDKRTGPPFVRALARRVLVANAAPIVAPTLGSQLLGLLGLALAVRIWLIRIVLPGSLFMCFAVLSVPALPVLGLRHNGHPAGTAAALLGATNFGLAGLLSPVVGSIDDGSAVPVGVVMGLTRIAAAALLKWLVVPVAAREDLPSHEDPLQPAS